MRLLIKFGQLGQVGGLAANMEHFQLSQVKVKEYESSEVESEMLDQLWDCSDGLVKLDTWVGQKQR